MGTLSGLCLTQKTKGNIRSFISRYILLFPLSRQYSRI